jgi:tetratricopeptide (TPR) repeat protein
MLIIEMIDWVAGESLTILSIVIIVFISLICLYGLFVNCKRFFRKNRAIRIEKNVTIKTPNVSAALSFALPGFGQIYNREIYRGSIYIILTLLLFSVVFFIFLLLEGKDHIVPFSISLPFILTLLFVYINVVSDAYRAALIINKKIDLAKRENGNSIVTMMGLGRALYSNKDYEAAINMYTEIIFLNLNHGLAYYNRGVIHYKLNNHLEAGNDFISAAKLGHKKSQRILKSEGIEYLNY